MAEAEAALAAPTSRDHRPRLAERLFALPDAALAGALIGLGTLTWWFFVCTSWGNLDNVGDMVESFTWGQEWQLGYYKHPPLFGWIAAAWFQVFPTRDVWFFALSMANVAVGLVALWFLTGYFTSGRKRVLSVGLLWLCTFYNIYAFRYNANSINLSLWPLAALFWYRSMRAPSVGNGILCGVFGAATVLAKYSGGLLLASILIWCLAAPEGRAYLRSKTCWIALAAFAVCVLPHLGWLFATDFLPFKYVDTRLGLTELQAAHKTFGFVIGQFLQLCLVLAVLVALLGREMVSRRTWSVAGRPERLALLLLTFGPFVLTVICCLALKVNVPQVWGIPIWFTLPLFFLGAPHVVLGEHAFRRAVALIVAVTILVPATGPVVYAVAWREHVKYATEPRYELAQELTKLWRTRTGTKLHIVAGTQWIAESMSFYSKDHPADFLQFSFRDSPWITPARLRRQGMAVVCEQKAAACVADARHYLPPGTHWSEVALARHGVYGTGPVFRYRVALMLPHP